MSFKRPTPEQEAVVTGVSFLVLTLCAVFILSQCTGCATKTLRMDVRTGEWHKETITPLDEATTLFGVAWHYLGLPDLSPKDVPPTVVIDKEKP